MWPRVCIALAQLWIVSVAEVLATARIADRYAASGTARHSLGLVV
jgi:hypothetical protein